MKRLFVLPIAALAMSPVFAANENEVAPEASNIEVATASAQAAPCAALPKISGYLQTGWNYNNPAGLGNSTSLQLLWKLLTSLTSFTVWLAATHILTTL